MILNDTVYFVNARYSVCPVYEIVSGMKRFCVQCDAVCLIVGV